MVNITSVRENKLHYLISNSVGAVIRETWSGGFLLAI